MADPVTLALIGSTLLSAVGSIQQGQAQAKQEKENQRAAQFNAQVSRNNAIAAQQSADVAAKEERREGIKRKGAITSKFGKGGVGQSGSSLLAALEEAEQTELEAKKLEFQGTTQSNAFTNQATLDDRASSAAGSRARSAVTGGAIGAGSSILKGFSR